MVLYTISQIDMLGGLTKAELLGELDKIGVISPERIEAITVQYIRRLFDFWGSQK